MDHSYPPASELPAPGLMNDMIEISTEEELSLDYRRKRPETADISFEFNDPPISYVQPHVDLLQQQLPLLPPVVAPIDQYIAGEAYQQDPGFTNNQYYPPNAISSIPLSMPVDQFLPGTPLNYPQMPSGNEGQIPPEFQTTAPVPEVSHDNVPFMINIPSLETELPQMTSMTSHQPSGSMKMDEPLEITIPDPEELSGHHMTKSSSSHKTEMSQQSASVATIPKGHTSKVSVSGSDSKTPSEYALHILFTQFVRHAERKLNLCLGNMSNSEPNISEILGEGVDPTFDKIIASLGYIARRKPKPVIDSVMFWRKTKTEAANKAAAVVNNSSLGSESSSFGSHSRAGSRTEISHKHMSSQAQMILEENREAAILAERKSLISIYILCRVLIEIVKQTPIESLGEDLNEKLEEIVFKQLRSTDPELFRNSLIRSANWNMFAELLGQMSASSFVSVGDRFIADLEKLTGKIDKDKEPHVELIIHGMRYLRLSVYPMEKLDDSAEFLLSIGKFFSRCEGQRIKLAYVDILTQLLLPISNVATAEVNHPTWQEATKLIFTKGISLLPKLRYWFSAFPLVTTILAVSPQEFFAENWMAVLESSVSKLKEKNRAAPSIYVVCVTRLVWVFLFRCTESLNNTTKKLNIVFKTLFSTSSKRPWITTDPYIQQSCTHLIRCAGYTQLQLILENILPSLLQSDQILNTTNILAPETLIPERIMIGIRSYLHILHDGETSERPAFLTDDILQNLVENRSFQGIITKNRSGTLISEFNENFCTILGRVLLLCDHHYGAKISVVDEEQKPTSKLKGTRPSMGVSFHFGSDHTGYIQKSSFYDLFCVIFETLPWCSPNNISYSKCLEIICRNTLHTEPKIAKTASDTLKKISKHKNAKLVMNAFSNFMFSFDEKLFSTYESSLSIASQFEKILALYVELLELWISKVKNSKPSTSSNIEPGQQAEDIDYNGIWTAIEEIEGNGLFFLCSQDRAIRILSVKILRLAAEFEVTVNEHAVSNSASSIKRKSSHVQEIEFSRLISMLDTIDISLLLKSSKTAPDLSTAERSRLHKLHGRKKETLARLAESDYGVDTAIWLKVFPAFIGVCFEKFPIPVAVCRNIVCIRLVQMHDAVLKFIESQRPQMPPSHAFVPKHSMRTYAEVLIEQWKIYLIVSCSTLTLTDEQKLHIPDNTSNHGRKGSVQKITIHHQKITSAKSVFRMIIPLLAVDHPVIRDSVVTGLTNVNINIYKSFIECIQPFNMGWSEHNKVKPAPRSGFTPKPKPEVFNNTAGQERMKTEITHVLMLTSHFLESPIIYNDEWIINQLMSLIKDLKNLLSRGDIQNDWDYQKLRRYFCGLLEKVFTHVHKVLDMNKLLPFEGRLACFTMMEEWCGHSQNWHVASEREAIMRRVVLGRAKDNKEHNIIIASMELEKRKLDTAALSSMAALCAGPTIENHSLAGGKKAIIAFNIPGLLKWVDTILANPSENMQSIGKRALKNILLYNSSQPKILNEVFNNCYREYSDLKTSSSYFTILCEVLLQIESYPCHVVQTLALALFKIGDEDERMRELATKLLKNIEKRFYTASCVKEYEVGIADKTIAVFKRTLFNISSRFASDHSDDAFMMVSELTRYFHIVSNHSRRDILAVLLPWLQSIELKYDPNDDIPDPGSQMVMNNLFEITVKFSDKIQNEVEALWVALGNGLFPSNINVVFKFLIHHSLERRDSIFVEYSRQVLVYLSMTSTGAGLMDTLVSYLQPRSMIPQYPEPHGIDLAAKEYPYVADLSNTLPIPSKETGFSHGQLALILLVDVMIGPTETMRNNLALLFNVSFVLLDHYLPIVHEQAKEMLIHIIHEMSQGSEPAARFIDTLKQDTKNVRWSYDDLNHGSNGARTPKFMNGMVNDILEMFKDDYPDLRSNWSHVALTWATTCPVRHIACRSFQLFRSLLTSLDQSMLADMLARLSNTISDSTADIQGFAMQILMTLNTITVELPPAELIKYPQLFWATVACLSTIHEAEFIEALNILETFISKVDLASADTVSCLISTFPPKWDGNFEGIQQIIMIGLRSANSWDQTIRILDKLDKIPDNEIVAGPGRIVFTILSNLPRYLHVLEIEDPPKEIIESSSNISQICASHNLAALSRIFDSYSKKRFRTKKDFLKQTLQALQNAFFPAWEAQSLVFILGLLSNRLKWIKEETLEILKNIFPFIDLHRDDFSGIGADLISPLLRLLQTDYAETALEVLDETSYISGSQMDRHVLRMSLGNRTIRKEYENTATLFGIPDDSGWSIPMPAAVAARTRNNVHSVFYTFTISKTDQEEGADDNDQRDEFEFHIDDYLHDNALKLSDTVSIAADDRGEGSLSHMWAELDNLDTFFAKDVARKYVHARDVSATDTEISTDQIFPVESAPQFYDKKVSIILNRSLARNPSTTSFKTSLADSFGNNPVSVFSSPERRTPPSRSTTPHNQQSRGPIMNRRRNPMEDLHDSRDNYGNKSPYLFQSFPLYNTRNNNSKDFYSISTDDEDFSGSEVGSINQASNHLQSLHLQSSSPASPITPRYSNRSSMEVTNFSMSSPSLNSDQFSYNGDSGSMDIPVPPIPKRANTQEGSFRLESLLRGASSLGKSKKKSYKDLKEKAKEPKVKEPKVKEPKVKEPKVKEPKVKEPKVKEPKVKESKEKESKKKIKDKELLSRTSSSDQSSVFGFSSHHNPLHHHRLYAQDQMARDSSTSLDSDIRSLNLSLKMNHENAPFSNMPVRDALNNSKWSITSPFTSPKGGHDKQIGISRGGSPTLFSTENFARRESSSLSLSRHNLKAANNESTESFQFPAVNHYYKK